MTKDCTAVLTHLRNANVHWDVVFGQSLRSIIVGPQDDALGASVTAVVGQPGDVLGVLVSEGENDPDGVLLKAAEKDESSGHL